MSRWIDAEWLKQNFNTVFWSQITKTIDSAPSIDIVRCGECKYWRTKYFKDGHGWCEWHINETKADDFCSYGIRSEKPNNSTISKMEQVDKDINVRSKDEPQTCSFSDCDNFKNPDYERCIECKRKQIKLKTEQTERSSE